MGNKDSILEAVVNRGLNQIIEFEGGYFSFAFGSEIALVIGNEYFILNCGEKLFNAIKNKISEGYNINELIDFWLMKSDEYEISAWSSDFKKLLIYKNVGGI